LVKYLSNIHKTGLSTLLKNMENRISKENKHQVLFTFAFYANDLNEGMSRVC
jgi:hypothetical protein